MEKRSINIASFGGRSHLLDTARELEKFGYKVRFYSFVPKKRAKNFGLKRRCSYSYFIFAVPFLVLFRCTKRAQWTVNLFYFLFDIALGLFMKPCDILICQKPMFKFAIKRFKRKKSIVILESGFSQIDEYVENLKLNPVLSGKDMFHPKLIQRTNQSYILADYISVGANHVKQSFVNRGIDKNKIFVNNYGVSLKNFTPTRLDKKQTFDFIMVGQWCYRKGADLLIQFFKKQPFSLLHVGSIVDVEFPDYENFMHIDQVDELQLASFYRKAKVFILPSREEGLALVQIQALSCGLPIVCSKKTGGEDLKKYTTDEQFIQVMSEINIESMEICAEKALKIAQRQSGIRKYTKDNIDFSWSGYGKRYNEFLKTLKRNE